MNSLNYPGPPAAREMSNETRARGPQTLGLSAFAHSAAYATGATGKQRALVSALVLGVQVVFVLGLAFGLSHKRDLDVPPALTVDLLPAKEEEVKPPPPPIKPLMMTPQIQMTMPPTPQIYVPPPLVQVQAPPSPITATVAPPPVVKNAPDPIQLFQVRLLRHLNRYKRYPASARAKREQGIVHVRFTMDRRGNVVAASVEKPSLFATLDIEGVEMLARAQPLPAPPPEMKGDTIEMIVPVEFSLKGMR